MHCYILASQFNHTPFCDPLTPRQLPTYTPRCNDHLATLARLKPPLDPDAGHLFLMEALKTCLLAVLRRD